jgi:hypothetical protein
VVSSAWLLLVVAASSLQARIEALRLRDAQDLLAPEARALLAGYLSLATCEARDLPPSVAARFAAESWRGRRLDDEGRQATVWRELAALRLDGNASALAVRWPASEERWSDEAPLVAALTKRCPTAQANQGQELMATETALSLLAPEGQDAALMRYHAAVLRFRQGEASTLVRQADVERLPASLSPYAQLLVAEAERARGQWLDAARHYRGLLAALPAERPALLARALEAALAAGDETSAQGLAPSTEELPAAVQRYFLAARLARLSQAGRYDDLVELVGKSPPSLAHDAQNDAVILEVTTDALSRLAFGQRSVEVCAALVGRAALPRQVLRLASLALSRGGLGDAEAALAWVHEHAPALHAAAHARLALVEAIRGDGVSVVRHVQELPAREDAFWDAAEAVVSMAEAHPSRGVIAELRTLIAPLARSSTTSRAPALLAALDTLEKRPPSVPLELRVPLRPVASPVVPPASFAFPEAYSLVPELPLAD